ncbi:MAG: hypothetical protein K6A44_07395 [bacterium]|nr:hypothetical protein [bacterium]
MNDKETATKLFITSQIKTSRNLVENSKYDTDVMGIKFTDGTSMLITYNPNCTGIDGGDTTGNTTGCFGYVADVNAEKSPNVTEKDIISNLPLIKNFGLSFDIQDYKIYLKEDAGYVDNSENGFSEDYWLAAQNKCEEQGASLPTADQLDEIAEKIYSNANCWMDEQYGRPYYQDCDYDIVTSSSLRKAITNSSFDGCVSTWAEEEGFFRCFGETWSDYNDNPDWRRGGTTFFCVK